MAVHHGGSDNTYKMYGVRTDSWGSVANDTGSGSTFTINSNIEVEYRIRIAKGYTCNNLVFKPKLVKGTKIGAYSKYGQGSVEISTSNKNIAKINEIDFELIENEIKNKAKNSGAELARFKIKKGEKIAASLTLKSKPSQDTSIVCEINNADVHDSTFYALQTLELNKRFTREIIAEENTEIVYRMWGNANSDIFEFQFSASLNEAIDYVEHHGETHIMPIQKKMFEKDGFEKIDGVNYEKHNKKEKVITGDDVLSVASNNRIFFKMSSVENIKELEEKYYSVNNIDKNTIECSIAKTLTGHSLTWLATVKKGDYVSAWNNYTGQNGFVLRTDKEFTTKEEAIAYFNENPFTVVYELLDTEYIKCTSEQSAILDKIDTYKDTTIITTDNDLCKISLRYKQSLEAAIKEYTATNVAESEE